MVKLQQLAFDNIKEVDEKLVATVCGSFRRGAASSGDIDVLLGHPGFTSEMKKKPDLIKRVVLKMEETGFVTDTLSLGEAKFMVRGVSVVKGGRLYGSPLCKGQRT